MNKHKTIIVNTAKLGLDLQKADGSMPSGHNGNRNERETPLRNTAHWSILFFKSFEITNNRIYLNAAKRCIEFILLPKWRPENKTFFLRYEGKNNCNGLIGQVWVLQALLYASNYYKKNEITLIVTQVFESIPYTEDYGLWSILEVDGSSLGIARTFNQQLWMAVLALSIFKQTGNQIALKKAQVFFTKINDGEYFHQDTNGMIQHIFFTLPIKLNFLSKTINNIIFWFVSWQPNFFKKHYEQSIGYQAFNLQAFGFVKRNFPSLLSNQLLTKIYEAITFVDTNSYFSRKIKTGFGFSYNPVGWEMAYVSTVFKRGKPASFWIDKQLEYLKPRIYSNDKHTLLARTYELCLLD